MQSSALRADIAHDTCVVTHISQSNLELILKLKPSMLAYEHALCRKKVKTQDTREIQHVESSNSRDDE